MVPPKRKSVKPQKYSPDTSKRAKINPNIPMHAAGQLSEEIQSHAKGMGEDTKEKQAEEAAKKKEQEFQQLEFAQDNLIIRHCTAWIKMWVDSRQRRDKSIDELSVEYERAMAAMNEEIQNLAVKQGLHTRGMDVLLERKNFRMNLYMEKLEEYKQVFDRNPDTAGYLLEIHKKLITWPPLGNVKYIGAPKGPGQKAPEKPLQIAVNPPKPPDKPQTPPDPPKKPPDPPKKPPDPPKGPPGGGPPGGGGGGPPGGPPNPRNPPNYPPIDPLPDVGNEGEIPDYGRNLNSIRIYSDDPRSNRVYGYFNVNGITYSFSAQKRVYTRQGQALDWWLGNNNLLRGHRKL